MRAFRESATAHFSFVASKLYLTGDMIACMDVSVVLYVYPNAQQEVLLLLGVPS